MRAKLAIALLLLLLLAPRGQASISVEFQLGSVDFPTGTLGMLVADTAGNGFQAPSNAAGTTLAEGMGIAGGDDIIIAIFTVGEMTDWGNGRGFATVLPPIDYEVLGIAEGQDLIFYCLPGRQPGDQLRADEPVVSFRTTDAANLFGNMDFVLPRDGGAYQLAALGSSDGGTANLAGFANPGHDLTLASTDQPGTPLDDGTQFDFGLLSVDDSLQRQFVITNRGLAPLTHLDLLLGGPGAGFFQLSSLSRSTLAPGDSLSFDLLYPPSESGVHSATLQVRGEAPGVTLFEFHFDAIRDHRANKPVGDPETPASPPAEPPVAWSYSATGLYDGLLRDQADGTTLLGAINELRVRPPTPRGPAGGAVSGRIRMEGRTAILRGAFDGNGVLDVDLPQRDGSLVEVDLRLMEGPSGRSVEGTVAWNGTIAEARLPQAPYHPRFNPAPPARVGSHTMIFPSQPLWGDDQPGGDGWATVRILTSGRILVAGLLGDGTRFTEIAFLSSSEEFQLYRDLYRSLPEKGRFGGTLTFREVADVSDFDGLMQWRKFPDAREHRYPGGFSVEVWGLGSAYQRPDRGARALATLTDEEYNAELSFIGPTAPTAKPSDLDRVLSWFSNNRLVHYGPEKLFGFVNARTGQLRGSYFDPQRRVRVRFSGVVFQRQQLATGNFVNGNSSGAIRIQPGTAWQYPGSEDAGLYTRIEVPGSPAAEIPIAPASFAPEAGGNYGGILSNGTDSSVGGLTNLRINGSGIASGLLWFEGNPHRFRGPIDGQEILIPRRGLDPLVVTLSLVNSQTSAAGFQLVGEVAVNGQVEASIDAQRREPYNRFLRAPREGTYTLAMRAPEGTDRSLSPAGDGYGNLAVTFLGTCRGLLSLPDGTRTALLGHVSVDDEFSLYRPLYGPARGYLTGKLRFRAIAGVSDFDGPLHWVRPAGSRPTTRYPAGFDDLRTVVGSRYLRPAFGDRAFSGLADDHHNAWFRVMGADFENIDRVVTWDRNNRVTYYGPEILRLVFNRNTGLFTGLYRDRQSGLLLRVGGAYLDAQGVATGYYLHENESELISLEPR